MKHIKAFEPFLNEANISAQLLEAQDKVINSMGDLEKLIKKESGIAVKLVASKMSHINWHGVRIQSADLSRGLGPVGQTIFSSFQIKIDGGGIIYQNSVLRFEPEIAWQTTNGQWNGTPFIWDFLWYNVDEEAWILGNKVA